MLKELIKNKIINRTTFITGNGKNAGKTTFLNYILNSLRPFSDKNAYLTIGIDGEKEDMIFGTPKPGVYAEKGDYVVTCDSALAESDAEFEILEVFPYSTRLGKLLLLKNVRPGSIELIGPENNLQLSRILCYLKDEQKINTILIDGAVNRITQVASMSEAGFIYVLKVAGKNLMKSINQIRTISLVKNFPVIADDISRNENIFECDGALTNIKASKIPDKFDGILVNDFTKIFLDWNELAAFRSKRKIYYKKRYELLFFTVNLIDIGRVEFEEALKANNVAENIIYNPYQL